MENKVDLYQPIYATRIGLPPLVVKAVVTTNADYMVGGMPQAAQKVENYILLSALPKELQDRVATAVQALIAGM